MLPESAEPLAPPEEATELWNVQTTALAVAVEFEGTPRYQVIRTIGRGGMGRVYEVFDRERGIRVALKTMVRRNSHWLVRFKREFRLVADLHHPNIARLYDLEVDGDVWFFTMELVEGLDVLRFVRLDTPMASMVSTAGTNSTGSSLGSSESIVLPNLDPMGWEPSMEARLRNAASQLAAALQSLHERGIVHRDIKPSNVLVTPQGRLALLDFGISRTTDATVSEAGKAEGTPAFMAPEQIRNEPAGPAADWYAFGCLLYAALTGSPPFSGGPTAILQAKREDVPIASPSTIVSDVPRDLSDLAMELLAHAPDQRPTGTEVLRRLQLEPLASTQPAPEVFVGRAQELRALKELRQRSAEGCTFAVIQGPSGMGKTALIRRFLAGQRRSLVLWGRCHERENVPFRAFDATVDGLADLLSRIPPDQLDPLLPDEACVVERLFPCFGIVPSTGRHAPRWARTPAEERFVGFVLLREILRRVAAMRPLVIVIDDLQWADAESLELLRVLLDEPARAPNLTFVATSRDEIAPETRQLLERALEPLGSDGVRWLQLGPLSEDEQRSLAERLGDSVGSAVWSAAGGVPLVLAELVHHASTGGVAPRSFDEAIRTRLTALAEHDRELLLVASTAGRPTPLSALASVAGIEPGLREQALSSLRAARLLRTVRPAADPWVDVVHDRLRDSILATDDVGPHRHRALAEALGSRPDVRRETVAWHWLAGGEAERAASEFEAAGHDAARRLAFEAAAEFFGSALRHAVHPPERAAELHAARADALSNAGRAIDAAEVYAAAVAIATDESVRRHLARRHAEALLHGGAYEQGKAAIREVLRDRGIRMPRSVPATVLSMLGNRLRLEVGRYREHEHRRERCDAAARERLELWFDTSLALLCTDQISGAALALRHLREALHRGDDEQLGLAMSTTLILLGSEGRFQHHAYLRFCEQLRKLADEAESTRIRGVSQLALGICTFMDGAWHESFERLGQAVELFASEPGTGFERHTALLYRQSAGGALGRLKLLREETDAVVHEAPRTKNPYEWVSSGIFMAYRCGLDHDMNPAEEYYAAVEPELPRNPGIPHIHFVNGGNVMRMLQRDAARSQAWTERWFRSFQRALVFVNPCAKAWFFEFAARGLALSRDPKLMKWVERHHRSVLPKMRWTAGTTDYIGAVRASLAGDRTACIDRLRAAIRAYRDADYGLWLYPTLHRLGTMVEGAEARDALAEADAWARAQGMIDPEHWLESLCPI